jgi:hypothetical protein
MMSGDIPEVDGIFLNTPACSYACKARPHPNTTCGTISFGIVTLVLDAYRYGMGTCCRHNRALSPL